MPIVDSLIAASSGSMSLLLLEITRDYMPELFRFALEGKIKAYILL